MTRRSFFDKIFSALFGGTGLAFAGSALAFLYPNKNFISGTRQFSEVTGKPILDRDIAEGQFVSGLALGSPAIVSRQNGELIAFSAVCTHLGCTVSYQPQDEILRCPCHGGEYDIDGSVIDGPPPKPLPKLNVKIEDGKIMLS